MKGYVNFITAVLTTMNEEESMGTGQGLHAQLDTFWINTSSHLLSQYRLQFRDLKVLFFLSHSLTPTHCHQRNQMNEINLPQHLHKKKNNRITKVTSPRDHEEYFISVTRY